MKMSSLSPNCHRRSLSKKWKQDMHMIKVQINGIMGVPVSSIMLKKGKKMDNVNTVFVLDSVCLFFFFFCHHINQIQSLMSPCSCVYSEDRDREVAVCFVLSIQNPNKSYRHP